MNKLLTDLGSAAPDEALCTEFPDLFYWGVGTTRHDRIRVCINELCSKLVFVSHYEKSGSLGMEFEDLPTLQAPSGGSGDKNKDIDLIPSPKQSKTLCIVRHNPSPEDRLCIIPCDSLNPFIAAEYEYFLIDTSTSSNFFRDLAIYKSCMIAANCRLFSHGFLAPGMSGDNHLQAGGINWFPLPKLSSDQESKLKKLGQHILHRGQKLIRSSRSLTLYDLCNPKVGTPLANELQKVDDIIDPIYGLNRRNLNPITETQKMDALLQIYAKTPLIKALRAVSSKDPR